MQRGSVLTASDAEAGDNFGISVALSSDGSVLAVGALWWDGPTYTDQGGVYSYWLYNAYSYIGDVDVTFSPDAIVSAGWSLDGDCVSQCGVESAITFSPDVVSDCAIQVGCDATIAVAWDVAANADVVVGVQSEVSSSASNSYDYTADVAISMTPDAVVSRGWEADSDVAIATTADAAVSAGWSHAGDALAVAAALAGIAFSVSLAASIDITVTDESLVSAYVQSQIQLCADTTDILRIEMGETDIIREGC